MHKEEHMETSLICLDTQGDLSQSEENVCEHTVKRKISMNVETYQFSLYSFLLWLSSRDFFKEFNPFYSYFSVIRALILSLSIWFLLVCVSV